MIGELTEKQKKRRDSILNSATNYFARYGYCAADMEKIARAAGVGKGTLYNYFGNKDSLYLKCVEHHFESALSYIDSRTSGSKTVEDFVTDYLDASIEYFSDNLDSFDLIIRSNSDLFEEVAHKMEEVKEKYHERFQRMIGPAAKAKNLNPQIVVLALDASTTFIMSKQFKKNQFEVKEVEETLHRLFLSGLLKKE